MINSIFYQINRKNKKRLEIEFGWHKKSMCLKMLPFFNVNFDKKNKNKP